MQDTRVQSPVQEGPTCHVATKPVYYNCWACALEPRSSITEAQATLEPVLHNKQGHCNEKPMQHN